MKVAIDIHDTIDSDPEFFSDLIKSMRDLGFEVYITTGVKDSPYLREQLKNWKIEYDELFSITDYHCYIGTPILWDEKGNPHIEECMWDATKTEFCKREHIDVIIDDSEVYQKYFEGTSTRFILYRRPNVK